MRLASLAMYVSPPPVADATRRLWEFLRDALGAEGIADVPQALDESVRYDGAWLQPGLLLAQTCGYPFVSRLRGEVRLVATPAYGHAGCDGPAMCSFIVVHRDNPAATLTDLRGSRAGINDPQSNSGMNLFRAAIAPIAQGRRFFGSVAETGGHVASIDAVAARAIDVAAIDCVTFGNLRRFDPARLASLRILAETPRGPGLPLITRLSAPDGEVDALRRALAAAIADPNLADIRDTLSLQDFVILEATDYERLANLERAARGLGYPVLA